jgi:Ca2+/Na+ antiporter
MFAKREKAATAISGIFSGQLFNFLIGFGFSMVIQSLDGEY